MDFEIHVTLLEDDGAADPVWHFSSIDGDPDLGAGVKKYRTTHTATLIEALNRISEAKERWPNAIRYKVENILLDERRT